MIAKIRNRFATFFCIWVGLVCSPVAAQDSGAVPYRIKSGDTLLQIEDQYLRGESAWKEVARINKIREPRRLRIGSTIRVPRRLLKFKPVVLRVRGFSGPVKIANQQPVMGKSLVEGDVIETGKRGFVSFQGNGRSAVSLPSNTAARLIRARQYLLGDTLDVDFEIRKGRGAVVAPKLKENERFRIKTPLAVTAVRGTQYRVAHDPQSKVSLVEVTEGAVAVAAGNESGLAKSGFGIPLTDAGVGEVEALLAAPELVDPGAIQTDASVSFAIKPLAGAIKYRTQIAKDAGFFEILREQISADPQANFDALDNGRYFVRSRGVSPTGIEGVSETYSFKRKRVGVSAEAGRSALDDGFKFSWLPEGDGNTRFAFQLWRADSPQTLLVDEVGVQEEGFVVTGLENGTYLWRVAAMQTDADGMLKIWSPEQKLQISE